MTLVSACTSCADPLARLTPSSAPAEMLSLSEKGDNSHVDMLVGDIYGADYNKIGLKSSTIASSFGKVFQKGPRSSSEGADGAPAGRKRKAAWKQEDLAKSLLYAVSNNIGQIACVRPAALSDSLQPRAGRRELTPAFPFPPAT